MASGQDLNPVKPKVTVAGEVINFESLNLEQQMNSTHSFEVVQEFMSQDELWEKSPSELLQKIGSPITIQFEHMTKGGSYEFQGIVTDVQIGSWDTDTEYAYSGHQSNRVHLLGHGAVVKLDNVKGMDSFVNTTLSNIFSENKAAISSASSSLVCNPKYTGPLQYVMRYNESLWEFFNRLSSIFNELFFYDGKNLIFGKPNDSETVELSLGQDLVSFRTSASAAPRNFARYAFMEKEGKEEIQKSSPKKLSSLMGDATMHNNDIYAASENDYTHSEYPIVQTTQLKALLEARQTAADGSVLNVEGVTHTCKVKLGSKVSVKVPSGSLGVYRVMSIEHRVDKMGNYSNHFVASPIGVEPVPSEFNYIKAFPEVATVKSNADPENRGRVQVQFDWQKACSKNTNWIRVQSPDAGGSGMKNRGFVFVPEEGDQVMVGFEFGDPNRPYVMGSLFHGKNGLGGSDSNNIHSIVTKSGRQIVFDDSSDGGITITDDNGNVIQISTSGGNIEIGSVSEISIHSKNIKIKADENVEISAGKDYKNKVEGSLSNEVKKDMKTDVKGNYEEKVGGDFKSDLKGKSTVTVAKDSSDTVSGKMTLKVSKDLKADISGKLACEVASEGKLNSKSKMYVTAAGNVYIGK